MAKRLTQKKLLASEEDWRGLLATIYIIVGWIAVVLLACINTDIAKLAVVPKLLIDREIATNMDNVKIFRKRK